MVFWPCKSVCGSLNSKLWSFKFYRRAQRFDNRSGFFSSGIPSIIILLSILATGTFIVDKQLEVKYARESKTSLREMTLKQEHEEMLKMLAKTTPNDQLDNSVPIPRIEE